jgi:hypothetical protein
MKYILHVKEDIKKQYKDFLFCNLLCHFPKLKNAVIFHLKILNYKLTKLHCSTPNHC